MAVPLPYGLSLTILRASSYVATRVTVRTGPKISSRYASIDVVTSSMSETPRKNPSDSRYRGCSRPSVTTFAPWAAAESRYVATLSRWTFVTRGPISAVGSDPGPTLILGNRFWMAATRGSATLPTATTVAMAMHRSPDEP